MKINEIITEASAAEKRRQKDLKQREQNAARAAEKAAQKKEQQARAAEKIKGIQAAPGITRKVDYSNPWDVQLHHDEQDRRAEQFKKRPYYFRFQLEGDRLLGYWTREINYTINDARRFEPEDHIVDVTNYNAPEFLNLFQQIGSKEGYLIVLFNKQLFAKFPGVGNAQYSLERKFSPEVIGAAKPGQLLWGHTKDGVRYINWKLV